ncbi:MAG TPA: thiol reductant ABC exporter subunit CydD [Pseudonocardiaceae bacterium]|jgi:ATP-binding cassette subfamily C protein CydCD|nr:thiol reductant ABC exporter subunit CydD [Pseudonocardiaceae bacterium]
MAGPLGALPLRGKATRRALVRCALLSAGGAIALVGCAWALSAALAAVVAGRPDITGWLVVLAVAIVSRALFTWAVRTVAARAAAGAKEELRGQLLDAAQRHGPEWIAERGPAELTALATGGLDALDNYFVQYLPALVTAAVVPALVGVAILVADWRSAVLVAITVPLIPVFAALIGRYTGDRVARAADANQRLAGHLLELVRALPVLTAFRRAAAQSRSVRRVSDLHRRATTATLRVAFLSALVLEVLATLSVALVAVGVGLRLVDGGLGLATGLLVLILVPECYLPLRAAGAAYHACEDGLEAVRRVTELAPADTGVGVGGGSVPKGVHPGALRHQLAVTGLRVRRRDGFAPDGESFTVAPGEIARLDSPSGAGKSTTLAVLLGFVAPERGDVTVDGMDIAALDQMAWRQQIAWVPQRPRFTGPTVADELRLAVSDLEPASDAEITAAAVEAAAGHLLGRRVDELSAGEGQRVALARALLRLRRGAWLLLLDEPTAHLDRDTAAQVGMAIRAAADAGAAVVLATHRELTDPELDRPTPDLGILAAVDNEPAARRMSLAALGSLLDWRTLAGVLLGAAALGSGVALTGTAAWLIARASEHPPILTLSVAIVAVRAFGLGKGVLRYAERLVSHDAAFRRSGRLRVRLWQALVALGPARTARLRRDDGPRRLVDDTDTVRDLVPRVLQPPLVALAVAVLTVVAQAMILPAAGLALALALLVAGIGAPLVALWCERRASTVLAAGRRRFAGAVLGLLDASADLIACGAFDRRRRELATVDSELAGQARRQAVGAGAASGVTVAVLGFAALACAWLAASAARAGALNPVWAPVLALLPLALAETLDGLAPAAQRLDVLRTALARITDITGIADTTITDTAITEPVAVPAEPTTGEIRLDNVDVRWPDTPSPTLRGVSVRIPAGAEVAVVGPSGAGKSTLLALLLGFLPAEQGFAMVPADVAWCPQDPQLVSTTVRENLRLGDPHADDDALRAALRQAALDDWVDRLDVPLGPGGVLASGGEAARLALARALLRAPRCPLVLLDEPTAHLDEPTAQRIVATVRDRLAGHTLVHVTHRPAEAAAADLVITVDNGRVTVAPNQHHHPEVSTVALVASS